jgi:hypothetical protein
MATVASAFCDLPAPPYSRPNDYEALVNAMVQELYRLNPEWVERKERLEQVSIFPMVLRKSGRHLLSLFRGLDQGAARGRGQG